MHVPGVDVLTEGNRKFWIVKQLSSAARQLGQRWLLSELYGVTGWQFDFEAHKAGGDWQALFGINLRCPHLSWYTMAGEAKRDYPASIFYQSGWWRDYGPVETYFARLGLLLQQGKPYCDLLVVNPVESLWSQIHVDWTRNIATAKDAAVLEVEKAYGDLFHWLAGAQIDFDYGDEEMMSRLWRIEHDEDDRPVLWIGEAPYRAVLVGKMTTICSDTLMMLYRFHRVGGKVIFAGDAPAYVDARRGGTARSVAERAIQCDFDRDAVVNAVRKCIRQPVQIVDGTSGRPLDEVFCQMRVDGDRRIVVAMNVNRDRWYKNALVRVPGTGHVIEWNCLTIASHAIATRSTNGMLEFMTDFPPSGEHVYVIEAEKPPYVGPKPNYAERRTQVCEGPFEYGLNEKNVCVLDMATFRIDAGQWQGQREVLKIDQAVRGHFRLARRGGEMVQPWYSRKHWPKPDVKGRVTMKFPFRVDKMPASPVALCIERPEHFDVRLNGRTVASEPTGWWIDPAITRLPLPLDEIAEGENTIELEMDFSEDRNIEAIYLIGDFGVRVDGITKTLTALPERLHVGDVTVQGLPFYSGAIRYKIPVDHRPRNGERVFIELPSFEGAVVRVSSGDYTSRLIAWQPYEADVTDYLSGKTTIHVDVSLTRRNTFGPLHLVPKRSAAYGPGHWTTGGKQWSDDYQLWEAGLLAAPRLRFCDVQ
jgi:hypothetical protein